MQAAQVPAASRLLVACLSPTVVGRLLVAVKTFTSSEVTTRDNSTPIGSIEKPLGAAMPQYTNERGVLIQSAWNPSCASWKALHTILPVAAAAGLLAAVMLKVWHLCSDCHAVHDLMLLMVALVLWGGMLMLLSSDCPPVNKIAISFEHFKLPIHLHMHTAIHAICISLLLLSVVPLHDSRKCKVVN